MATATKKSTRSAPAKPRRRANDRRRRATSKARQTGGVRREAKKLAARSAETMARMRRVLEPPLRASAERLARARDGVANGAREHNPGAAVARLRRVPIQCSLDIGVPLEVAFDEWLRLDFLPEGAHRVEEIERDHDGHLAGRVSGFRLADDWEAEIRDERRDESFAWRSVRGSDCAGLVTFHRLGERLTRVELELDVIPSRLGEAMALLVRLADRRAETDLRRFKAALETINPDDYPPLEESAREDEEE